jgi:hypothetical protein
MYLGFRDIHASDNERLLLFVQLISKKVCAATQITFIFIHNGIFPLKTGNWRSDRQPVNKNYIYRVDVLTVLLICWFLQPKIFNSILSGNFYVAPETSEKNFWQ